MYVLTLKVMELLIFVCYLVLMFIVLGQSDVFIDRGKPSRLNNLSGCINRFGEPIKLVSRTS